MTAATPQDPAAVTFDVDAWLTDAAPPQRAVTVYARGDLLSKLQELDAQPPAPGEAQVIGGSQRDKEIRRLKAQIEASARTIHVRGLLGSEREQLLAKHGGGPDASDADFDGLGYEIEGLTVAAVQPTFTEAQARKLYAALGDAQWREIWQAINAATLEPIDVPLSRIGSGSTGDS